MYKVGKGMNFKSMFMGAATAVTLTATALVAAPAQAATITSDSILNLNSFGLTGGGVKRSGNKLDFFSATLPAIGQVGQGTSVAGSTGSFENSNFSSFGAEIKDLTLAATSTSNIFTSGPVANFLTGINLFPSFSPVSFDLSSFVYNSQSGGADITGIFKSGSDQIFATGIYTSQTGTGGTGIPAGVPLGKVSSYSLSLFPTAIPTPALLPGLVAFGVGVLRKRKSVGVAESDA